MPPDASSRDSRRTGRCPSRLEAAQTVAGHVAAKEVAGRKAGGRAVARQGNFVRIFYSERISEIIARLLQKCHFYLVIT